ncbi:MAG: restriction endonuclease subunit S [Bacilli bacterium]|nr:restriction endonuclease subunit S [Bacilli bacterium]
MSKYTLKELLNEINDKTTVNNQYEVLTSSQNGIVSQADYFKKNISSTDNTGYKIIKKGQFTYRSMSDTGYFYINLLSDREIGIVSPAYPVFEIKNEMKEKVLTEYLALFFKTNYFMEQTKKYAKGSTRLSLKFKQIINVEIEVPEIDEQRKIVEKISNINKASMCLKNTYSKLNELLNSLFENAIINNNVSYTKFKDLIIGKPEYGIGESAIESDEVDVRYVRITDIDENGDLVAKKVTIESPYDFDHYLLSEGEIIFARTGATVGKTYLYNPNDGKCLYAGYLIRFVLNSDLVNPYYIKQFTRTHEYWNWVNLSAKVGTQPNINAQQYSDLLMPVINKNAQDEFAKTFKNVENMKKNIVEQMEQLNNLTNSYMNEYYS